MSKIAYFDCPTGIAGDMCLGALVDAGVPVDYLTEHLNRLGVEEDYRLRVERVRRNGISAMKAYVDLRDMTEEPPTFDAEKHHHHHHHHHSEGNRYLPEIEEMLQSADIPDRARKWSLAVFRRLAAAEGAVHGVSLDRVHFHEVGATDAIVDIVGTCLGLDWLEIDRLYCSPLPTGGGTVKAAHGRIPIPAPAVLKLWQMRQVPVYGNGIDRELVTPTGAALTVTLAESFGVPPAMTLQQTGLGAGSQELAIPNLLRLWIGEDTQPSAIDRVCVLETQLDDISPQAIGYVFEQLFEIGALDVFTQPLGMKKNRPGILLTVICSPDKQTDCEAVLFRETTTLGIRHSFQERSILSREFRSIALFESEVRVKIARDAKGNVINVQPEYEDVAKLARKQEMSWQEVHRLALQQWQQEKAE
ncbi:nickel pincer cofactor biosynthesis protein LarC [Baaleninema sp.]|uniref:nickel pincer cofactor biosynthesis protein LarC n=1 Tax=Baaleninema sp. TaxID=3101197 RepID=UPI003CFE2CC1